MKAKTELDTPVPVCPQAGQLAVRARNFNVIELNPDGSVVIGNGDAAASGSITIVDSHGQARLTIGVDGKLTILDQFGNPQVELNPDATIALNSQLGANGTLTIDGTTYVFSKGMLVAVNP